MLPITIGLSVLDIDESNEEEEVDKMMVYIPKNTQFPCSVTKTVYTAFDDQTECEFEII